MHEAWPTDLAWALPPDAGKPIEKLSLASARPRRLRAWLATLSLGEPMADPARGVLPLLRLLEELSLLRVDARRRLALLEEVRPGVHQLAQALEADFLNQPLVPPARSRAAADHARALFEGLALGYQAVAVALLKERLGRPERQAAATTLQRAAEALAQRLCLAWLLYTPVPEGLWRRLHSLHATAERHALQDVTVADPLLPGREGSVHLAYTRLLLVASAQPNRLRPSALLALYRAAGHWSRWLVLHGDRGQARFRVDPESDQGPRPVAGGDPPGHLYFDPRPLAEALAGDGAASPLGDILLNQLRAVWLAAPDRARPRHAVSGESGLLLGLKAAHDGLERAGVELDPHPVRWLDRAEGGCRLAWSGPTPRALRTGGAVAVRDPDTGAWRVGEVRWVARHGDGAQLGVALWPVGTRPVRLSHGYGDTLPVPALLVPAGVDMDADTLLVPTAEFRAGARVTIWEGPPRLARLGIRVAVSPDVARFTLRPD
ncbi:MAG: hypothetical protein CL543_00700 [Alcanivorax sp.]|nr:hypothetical protein [Alcanivorax sp.]MBM1144316.1 hypothetical protein [Alcanivorax sp. ZXX171]MAY11249.1 hypothetical protein [Alcanivorax sp.]MBI55300.1 hypothetical protein [Alcanivorax sp.]MBU57376.1 hypothetical protein [Alcanivorax sp.]|tara:strand:- start:75647 stop:77116 length:1470 start_codon:yes stop_codon:yes gene_type:complete